MENCLGGSKRSIKAQKDLQQLKQQQQQLPINQNFYTQQQPQAHHLHHHRQAQHQQQQQQEQQLQHFNTTSMSTTPKFVANCLHFPPPPDYPPPPKTPIAKKTMSTANFKPMTTKPNTTTAVQHQHQQQQQQQQHHHHHQHHHIDNTITVEPVSVAVVAAATHNANHSSASSSPSSSSATSATTVGVSTCGRRQIPPRYPDPDPDAIEVCNEQEPINAKVTSRNIKTLGHSHQRTTATTNADIGETKWSTVQQTTSLQLLHQHTHAHAHLHPHQQHDYSYAYYEPGAAMRHSNIPPPEQVPGSKTLHTPPPPNSIRALLSKGKKNKLLVSPATRQSYQTRYGVEAAGGATAACGSESSCRTGRSGHLCGGGGGIVGISENFYEEISSTEARHQLRPTATSHSAGSLNQSLVEEERRRVQNRHRKILGELNLSVEAMLMPESPPNTSPTASEAPTVSVTATSGEPAISAAAVGLRLSSTSADNICDANISELLNVVGPTDELLSPIQNSTNVAFCADLDSGFSGSSGASYIGSLRLHKTNAALSHLMSTRQAGGGGGGGACSGSHLANTATCVPASASCSFAYATHSCRSFHRVPKHQGQQEEDDSSSSSFLTRASCGRRILNCAKIRAAEDPGPVVPTESKARSFWNRKGWRKLPGFSSTSSINDAGLTDEPKLNSGSWEDQPPPINNNSTTKSSLSSSPTSVNNGSNTTTTTAQLHNATSLRHTADPLNTARTAYNGLHPLLIPTTHHQQHQYHHQHSKSCGSPTSASKSNEAAGAADHTTTALASNAASTIAGGSFSTNGGSSAAVGVTTTTTTGTNSNSASKKRLEHTTSSRTLHSEDSWCSEEPSEHDPTENAAGDINSAEVATTSDEEAATEDERSVSSLSATNQRNSQLRSTFNKAKQHLSFDKWRSGSSTSGNATNSSTSTHCATSSVNGGIADSNSTTAAVQVNRRASAASATMPTAHQPPREDLTTPGESPGGRISRWFSIRRGSSHQYDVGGRDGRQSSSSSIDIPDATSLACSDQHLSPQKMPNLSGTNAYKMPGVPENDDEDPLSTSRFDMDLMIPPGSRANGTARTAHTRLITPMLPPAPPGLSQQQLKRRHIVAAIVHSENSYVATLQRLVNDYKKPLEESNPPVLSATKIGTLFHRLPEILQSHKLFRIALAECVRNWDRDEKLGDCFVSAFSKPRILEIYSGFINNFSAAMELAKMEEKRKSALADFFKVKQISAHDRLSFFGLMVKPVQRFPQFILFLQDILKYTPQGHHDRMSLQLALTQLELLAEMLNERKREAEQYQGFKEMLGHITGTFNTRSLTTTDGNRPRYLLREDNVTHMEFNQAGFIIKSKQRRLLLLNDKVICVSVAPKQSHDFGATEKLSFKWMYPVTDVEIVDTSTSATLSRILTAGLNRGGSLKSNSSSCNNNTTNTLPLNSPYPSASLETSPAAQLTNGADNLCNEMSTLMYDYEVISRMHDLVGSLKGTYKELNSNTTRNLLNTIQGSIQRKDEEMAWVDSCCLQLIARNKSGKEETFTFQTQNPNVKKEWITELRLAQLALDTNNSPAWEASTTEPSHAYEQHQQQQQSLQQKHSNKMPLFVKAMPVYKSQHQTEVRCGCFYSIANDTKLSGNARRRHKQLNYLWICTSDGPSSHIAVLSQHHQQAGNLRDVGSFDLVETQVTAMEFVKGLDNCKTREEYSSLLGDLIWMGTDSRKILIYSAQNPEQEVQLGCCTVPGSVMRILYHFDVVYVALSNSTMLIYRRSYDGVWMLKDPQQVQLGDSGLAVPSLLPINMNIYASCANRVYVLNALNGEIQKSFEVQHGANQQVNLMAHSGIGLWISLKNSSVLCLYHTETFKHLQDINIASSVLRNDTKKEQAVNNSSIYVTALMACKGLLWVGTNVGIAVTIPLPRLEGVPIISGGISTSCHVHFGPITFLLPLIPKIYPSYKPPPAQTLPASISAEPSVPAPPSMGEDLQLPAIDADPKKITEEELEETIVILRRDLPKDDSGSGSASPSASMLRDLSIDGDSAASSPRSSKLDKQNSFDQSLLKIRASLVNSPAFHRKRFRDLSAESARMSKTLPRGLGSAGFFNASLHSNTSTLNHGEHGYCDVYGLYGKLIFVKEDYDAEEGAQGNLMDMMYEGMRRSDPELAAIPGKVSTLDRRLRMKASRPRSLDLSNWSVDSKSSSLYTSSGSEESMGIRLFGGRSVSRNSSSASHKTSGNGSDLGNISENGLMTTAEIHQHSTPKSEDGFKLMLSADGIKQTKVPTATGASMAPPPPAAAAVATLKRKQKQNAKQQQQNTDGPRTIITLMGGRGYWRHIWYNNANSPGNKSATLSSNTSGASSPLIANSNDAHIVVWEKKL